MLTALYFYTLTVITTPAPIVKDYQPQSGGGIIILPPKKKEN